MVNGGGAVSTPPSEEPRAQTAAETGAHSSPLTRPVGKVGCESPPARASGSHQHSNTILWAYSFPTRDLGPGLTDDQGGTRSGTWAQRGLAGT